LLTNFVRGHEIITLLPGRIVRSGSNFCCWNPRTRKHPGCLKLKSGARRKVMKGSA